MYVSMVGAWVYVSASPLRLSLSREGKCVVRHMRVPLTPLVQSESGRGKIPRERCSSVPRESLLYTREKRASPSAALSVYRRVLLLPCPLILFAHESFALYFLRHHFHRRELHFLA